MKVDVKRRRGRPSGSTKLSDAYAHLADDPAREATDKVGAVIAGAEVVAIPRSSAMSEPWSLEELRIEDILLVALHDARNGLRRNSIDEVDELFEDLKRIDRKHWPPEVARFVARFKRPSHRMRSLRRTRTSSGVIPTAWRPGSLYATSRSCDSPAGTSSS
jgi:hypothetical protein